jgi:hypothetical protein
MADMQVCPTRYVVPGLSRRDLRDTKFSHTRLGHTFDHQQRYTSHLLTRNQDENAIHRPSAKVRKNKLFLQSLIRSISNIYELIREIFGECDTQDEFYQTVKFDRDMTDSKKKFY